MLTPLLEKAILNGWAKYDTFATAFSTFTSIPIPNNSTVIIVNVKWFPFLNPLYNKNQSSMTWRQLFTYNEYQLKIDGKKATNYLRFRNEINWRLASGVVANTFDFKLDNDVDQNILDNYFLPLQGKPIIENCYFVCEEYIKLSILKNVYAENIASDFGFLNKHANEQNAPYGVADMQVNLVSQHTAVGGGSSMFYTPPQNRNVPTPTTDDQNRVDYVQPVFASLGGIQNPTNDGSQYILFPYQTNPLVELGLVIINNAHFDKIQNS